MADSPYRYSAPNEGNYLQLEEGKVCAFPGPQMRGTGGTLICGSWGPAPPAISDTANGPSSGVILESWWIPLHIVFAIGA